MQGTAEVFAVTIPILITPVMRKQIKIRTAASLIFLRIMSGVRQIKKNSSIVNNFSGKSYNTPRYIPSISDSTAIINKKSAAF